MTTNELLKDYEPGNQDSIKICILNIIEANLDAIELEEQIRQLHQLSQINISTLKKYYKEETLKIDNYKKTSTREILPFFADKVELAKRFYEIQPFFYDKKKMWWFWNKEEYKYELIDETDLLIQIDACSPHNTVRSMEKSEIVEALKQVGRLKIPQEPPKFWIQFKDSVYDIKPKKSQITPNKVSLTTYHEYFMTNPIPYSVADLPLTPNIDKLFNEWVGKEYTETLYELIAYCCYPAYPIQLIFSLWGNGSNGKSQFLKILNKFIGKENITSTELDVLTNNRFESFKLYKKLICTIGETNFGILSNTSLIKKLTGGDLIGFEKKNKDPFDDYNYAKIIISSNSLPTSEDTSDGFYRRWLIIEFPNEFKDTGQEIWETIPEEEYEALAHKCLLLLPELLKRGTFTRQGDLKIRKEKYISVSNPLSIFIKTYCTIGEDKMISYNRLYTFYINYLAKHKRRRVKMREFKAALEDEGYYVERKNVKMGVDDQGYGVWQTGYYVIGLDCDNYDNYDYNLTPALTWESKGEIAAQLSQFARKEENLQENNIQDYPLAHFPCSLCGGETGENRLVGNTYVCPICFENQNVSK